MECEVQETEKEKPSQEIESTAAHKPSTVERQRDEYHSADQLKRQRLFEMRRNEILDSFIRSLKEYRNSLSVW